MSLERENIRHELEAILNSLAESKGEQLVRQIRPILEANLERGRVDWFIEAQPGALLLYVELVAEEFLRQHEMLHRLQYEEDSDLWPSLFQSMQVWAYNFLLRKGFARDEETQDVAAECAADAALNLRKAYFPYDTDFEAWAHIIVQNACRKYMERASRKSQIPGDQLVPLEDDLVEGDQPVVEFYALQDESSRELREALNELSLARRTVLQLIYLDGLSAAEAAERMGKSVGAIYSLQFNGLQDLRKILGTIRDNPNE